MKKIKWLIPIILSILLAGCGSDSKKIVELDLHYMTAHSAPAYSPDVNASAEIARSSYSVKHSMNQLSAIELASHPRHMSYTPLNARKNRLYQLASINWYGPLLDIMKKVAHLSHYSLHVLGQKPAISPMVVLRAHQQTLATIVRNIQYQTAQSVRISVYPKRNVIEIRYL